MNVQIKIRIQAFSEIMKLNFDFDIVSVKNSLYLVEYKKEQQKKEKMIKFKINIQFHDLLKEILQ